jgi:hypothetical protein
MAQATITFNPNTYAGEEYSDIAMPALIPANGNIADIFTVVTGVKSRQVLRTLSGLIPEFKDPSCTFVGQSGALTFGEKYIDPVKYEVMIEVCWDVLRGTWEQGSLKPGSANDYVPPSNIENAFLDFVIEKVGIMNEQLYFYGKDGVTEGVVSFSAAYDGLFDLLRADSTVKKYATATVVPSAALASTGITIAANPTVTVASTANLKIGDTVTFAVVTGGTTQVGGAAILGQSFQVLSIPSATTFTIAATTTGTTYTTATLSFINASNVIAFNTAIFNLIPKTIKNAPDLIVLMSSDLVDQYRLSQAQVATAQQGQYSKIPGSDFLGIKPIEMEWFLPGTALIYRKSNVFLGIDADGDDTQIRTAFLADATLDEVVRYKMSMKTDVNYIYGNEIFMIAPVIS